MEKDNIEYVKKLIREEGGYVSCVEPMGPVTVLFFTVRGQIYEQLKCGELVPMEMPRYERVSLEFQLARFDDVDELRPSVREIVESSDGMLPVFSVYKSYRGEDGKLNIRLGWINHIYGGKDTTETTYEEARELITNPPEYVHPTHIQDLKTVYKL